MSRMARYELVGELPEPRHRNDLETFAKANPGQWIKTDFVPSPYHRFEFGGQEYFPGFEMVLRSDGVYVRFVGGEG